MYPAAIRVATIAASVSVDMTLKISKNIEMSIMRLPTVPRQCFTMMSMIRRGLVARFRMGKFTRMAALRLSNNGSEDTKREIQFRLFAPAIS